jgi:hypothetical protein
MRYPLVRELAADGIPVTVTCRVLKIARQHYYRWLANPVTDAEWTEANRADARFNAHRDDPEFGYRFLADEARDAGLSCADRTAWRICSDNGWWSVFGTRKRGERATVGTAAHEDLVRRVFTPPAANQLWLTDHPRGKESCISARSRTSGPTASSGTPCRADGVLDSSCRARSRGRSARRQRRRLHSAHRPVLRWVGLEWQ